MEDYYNILPKNTMLGNLEFIEDYIIYDYPVIFTCKNKEQTFLCFSIKETPNHFIFLYIPIKNNKIKESIIKDFIENSKIIYKVYIAINKKEDKIEYESKENALKILEEISF